MWASNRNRNSNGTGTGPRGALFQPREWCIPTLSLSLKSAFYKQSLAPSPLSAYTVLRTRAPRHRKSLFIRGAAYGVLGKLYKRQLTARHSDPYSGTPSASTYIEKSSLQWTTHDTQVRKNPVSTIYCGLVQYPAKDVTISTGEFLRIHIHQGDIPCTDIQCHHCRWDPEAFHGPNEPMPLLSQHQLQLARVKGSCMQLDISLYRLSTNA